MPIHGSPALLGVLRASKKTRETFTGLPSEFVGSDVLQYVFFQTYMLVSFYAGNLLKDGVSSYTSVNTLV